MKQQWRARRAGAGAAVAALAIAVGACGGGGGGSSASVDLGPGPAKAGEIKAGALKGQTLTFTSYGGIYQDGQMKAAIDPFGQESGAKILQDGPTDYSKVKAQVESGNVTWDVVDLDATWAAGQCGKLLMPLDPKIVDTSKIPAGLATRCYVPAMQYGDVMVYNTKKYGSNPPKTWADFFDTKKFPGKRAIFGGTGDAAPGELEAALLADGVPQDKLYPLDVDRALRKLDTIRSSLIFWDTGARAQQMLESGEADMALLWTGRAYSAIKNGAPYAANWNQWFPREDVIAVPKNVRNPKASMAMVNYYLGAKQQEKLTELTSYSPINKDAKPKLDKLAQSFVTTTPERQASAVKVDTDWWGKNQPAIIDKYGAWLSK
ncbi:MAG TPA: ABC transporter substrate-binding protein [Capillimicrobium sp.]|nr:ABC transporter substrate-binding protein [Capillimicrobium sp.]